LLYLRLLTCLRRVPSQLVSWQLSACGTPAVSQTSMHAIKSTATRRIVTYPLWTWPPALSPGRSPSPPAACPAAGEMDRLLLQFLQRAPDVLAIVSGPFQILHSANMLAPPCLPPCCAFNLRAAVKYMLSSTQHCNHCGQAQRFPVQPRCSCRTNTPQWARLRWAVAQSQSSADQRKPCKHRRCPTATP
jgi:hypothetical protein